MYCIICNKEKRLAELRGVGTDWKTSYDYIWQTYMKEKQTTQLLPLQKEFYEDVQQFIDKLNASLDPEVGTIKTNVIKILNEMFNKRKQKLLLYAAYNRPLPTPAPHIEAQLYAKASDIMRCDLAEQPQLKAQHKLEALDNLPEIVLPNGSKIGPLEKGQRIDVNNEEEAKFLIEAGACKAL